MAIRRRIAILAFASGVFLGCADGERRQAWVHPDWAEQVRFTSSSSAPAILWQDGTTQLVTNNAAALTSNEEQLVMVTYRHDHPDRRLIEESLNLKAIHRVSDVHHALLTLGDQS